MSKPSKRVGRRRRNLPIEERLLVAGPKRDAYRKQHYPHFNRLPYTEPRHRSRSGFTLLWGRGNRHDPPPSLAKIERMKKTERSTFRSPEERRLRAIARRDARSLRPFAGMLQAGKHVQSFTARVFLDDVEIFNCTQVVVRRDGTGAVTRAISPMEINSRGGVKQETVHGRVRIGFPEIHVRSDA